MPSGIADTNINGCLLSHFFDFHLSDTKSISGSDTASNNNEMIEADPQELRPIKVSDYSRRKGIIGKSIIDTLSRKAQSIDQFSART